MQSLWNDLDAEQTVGRYAPAVGRDLALRVYTSRLIGRERKLVLHGGGNTSVKTTGRSVLGQAVEVICVKGSGHDLATIEPEGMPAMELQPLRALRALPALGDDEMFNQARRSMLDTARPNPSVEVLLHAFLPHKFVDHTHADAVLELTDRPDGVVAVREALGARVAVIPWVMPGFPLAKALAEAHDGLPGCEAVVVGQHGIFTFGPDARSSYERMIALVDRAERWMERKLAGKRTLLDASASPGDGGVEDRLAAVLPTVRGAIAEEVEGALGAGWRRWIVEARTAPDLIAFSRHADARSLLVRGPLTPDHVIRTKGSYLYLTEAEARDRDQARGAVRRFVNAYLDYYQRHRARVPWPTAMLDPLPRVAVVEGIGCIAFGEDKRAACIAADIAEQTLRSIARVSAVGTYQPLDEAGLFDIEYWPPELAKLGRRTPAMLEGQVALVTGAAGAIGHGIADALLAAGCHVLVTDVSEERLARVVQDLTQRHPVERVRSFVADLTKGEEVAGLFRALRLGFGGLDVLVPNAGIAHVAKLEELRPEDLRRVLEINVTGTLLVLREATAVFAEQATGGAVVVQSSKNVFDPGAGFGAYSASKAAVHQLGKIAALELAPLGVRVNMINADAVFGDARFPSGLWEMVGPERMRARGLDPEGLRRFYRERSLLKVTVLPAHVGQAVVFFAAGLTPTTGATLPVDAGIPGAFPR